MIVVDASVVVKLYVAEAVSDIAEAFYIDNQGALIAPDIIIAEVIGALVRRANIDKDRRAESERSIDNFMTVLGAERLLVQRMSIEAMRKAATLAMDIGHPVKDCIYLALAMEQACDLVTCDAKFAGKARTIWTRVRVLEE